MSTLIRFSRAPWRKRRSAENKQRHAAQARRAPWWDATLPLGSMSIRAAAQRLSVRQGELFAWLSARGWISTHPETNAWTARDTAIGRGWLATRRKTIGHQRYVFQALVTPLGLVELANHVLTADDGTRAMQCPLAQQCWGN